MELNLKDRNQLSKNKERMIDNAMNTQFKVLKFGSCITD